MNNFTMPPAPPLNCSAAAQTNNLEQCYDDYLIEAWSEFNQSLSEFQETCNNENGSVCDYSEMIPAYQMLMSSIDTVLSEMEKAIQKNVPMPTVQKGFADISAMRDNLNRKMRELNDDTTSNRGFNSDYKMKYDNAFYIRLVLVLAMAFFVVCIIYLMLSSPSSPSSSSPS
jgi:hypothetical protein